MLGHFMELSKAETQGPVYSTVTLVPLADALVRTRPFCSMLMIVAPERDAPPALAPVKVTVPKLDNGTRDPPCERVRTYKNVQA